MKTLLLLSGGLDSAVILADLVQKSVQVEAITFNYNQRHLIEVAKARTIARRYNVPHSVISFNLPSVTEKFSEVSSSFIPARNAIFLSIALNMALNEGFGCIAVGVNQTDAEGFPDCSSQFISAFQSVVDRGSPHSVKIVAPLINLEKHEVVNLGIFLGLDFSLTHTCYAPQGETSCGLCESCVIRLQAFRTNQVFDDLQYINTEYE